MKQILICLILACSCVVINPINSIAKGNKIIMDDLFIVNSEQIVKIEIISGVTGEQKNISSKEHIAEIMSIFNNGNFVEYEKSGNAGGWVYNLKIYSANNEAPFEYTISYGFVKDGKNYRLDNATNLKETVDKIFSASSPEHIILVSSENGDIKVEINNEIIKFNDAPFIDEKNRTQVPVRAVAEMLDCDVEWDGETKTAVIEKKDGTKVTITVGSDILNVGGNKTKMDTSAIIRDDRMYIPVRFVAEAMGLTVEWK